MGVDLGSETGMTASVLETAGWDADQISSLLSCASIHLLYLGSSAYHQSYCSCSWKLSGAFYKHGKKWSRKSLSHGLPNHTCFHECAPVPRHSRNLRHCFGPLSSLGFLLFDFNSCQFFERLCSQSFITLWPSKAAFSSVPRPPAS